ncbi:MAG: DMT family transporter [Cyanobacteria bacterium SZAS TMP-1]|nr:DMT family transporter [Cyanobacteria bacterium SZAS TMP-1]
MDPLQEEWSMSAGGSSGGKSTGVAFEQPPVPLTAPAAKLPVAIPARSYAMLFGAQLAIGAAAIFARYALHGTGPIGVATLRLSIAALPMLFLSRRISKDRTIALHDELVLASAGLALALHFTTWIASLQYTPVAVSTLLVCTTPLWTTIYDIVFLKQRKSAGFWLALFASAVGTALVSTASGAVGSSSEQALLGAGLALVGAVAMAGYLIAVRPVTSSYPTVMIVGRTYSWAALILLVMMPVVHEPFPQADPISWGGIIAMAVISQMLGHTGINASLRWFSSTTVALSTLLEPVFAAVLAAAIFNENLPMQSLIGCAVIMISLVFVLKSKSA